MDDPTREYHFDDLYNPEINAEYGCWYLNYLSNLFYGDPVLVAAAFHAGQGEVRNWLNPAEYSPDGRTVAIEKIPFGDTRRYVGRVMNDYAAYLRIYYGR
jgi:soluble lytic murein transglycosylase